MLLSVLLIIGGTLLLVTVPYFTVTVHLKNNVADISVRSLVFKKDIHIDPSSENIKKPKKEKPKKDKPKKKKQKKSEDSSVKLWVDGIKSKVYSKENGFDIDGAFEVKDELCEMLTLVFKGLNKLFGKIRYKIEVPMLNVNLDYGASDPVATGMIYGWIYSGLGIAYPLFNQYFKFNYPSLNVTPDFYGKRFNLEVRSIIRLRPIHVVHAVFAVVHDPGFAVLKYFLRKGHK